MDDRRPCGHRWRNNDFDCVECLEKKIALYHHTLTQIRDGLFIYNMGDYEACAKNAARLALEGNKDAE